MATVQAPPPKFELVTMPIRGPAVSLSYGDVGDKALSANDLLQGLIVEHQLTLNFTQGASTAAITPADPDWPHSAIGALPLESNVYKEVSKLEGRHLYLLEQESERGFEDLTTTYSLPPANTGTSAVQSTGTITAYEYIPVTVSLADLRGLIDLQADNLNVTVSHVWKSVEQIASLLNIPSGSSLTGVSGQTNWYAFLLENPGVPTENLAEYLSVAHRTSYVRQDIGGKTTIEYAFLRGPQLRRVGFLFLTPAGFRDVGNTLQVESLQIIVGNSKTPIDLPERPWRFMQNLIAPRFMTPLGQEAAAPANWSVNGGGLYWYDGTDGLYGRDYLRTNLYTSQSIKMVATLATPAPAGAALHVILDRFTGLRVAQV